MLSAMPRIFFSFLFLLVIFTSGCAPVNERLNYYYSYDAYDCDWDYITSKVVGKELSQSLQGRLMKKKHADAYETKLQLKGCTHLEDKRILLEESIYFIANKHGLVKVKCCDTPEYLQLWNWDNKIFAGVRAGIEPKGICDFQANEINLSDGASDIVLYGELDSAKNRFILTHYSRQFEADAYKVWRYGRGELAPSVRRVQLADKEKQNYVQSQKLCD